MTIMRSALVLPVYLLICLLLGGSQRDVWPNAILQLIAVFLIGFEVLRKEGEPLTLASRALVGLIISAVVLALAQVVPLPPEIWSNLPGRGELLRAYQLLGEPVPWLSWSFMPYATLDALTWCLPPIAILIASLHSQPLTTKFCAVAILAGALAGVLLGALQVSGGGEDWYPYAITNTGAVGFFANRNFMGTLLLVSVPFTFALLADRAGSPTSVWAMRAIGVAGLLVILVGLTLNQSMAALLVALPVAIASAALLKGLARFVRYALPITGLVTLAGILFLTNSPVGSGGPGVNTPSIASRASIWEQTWNAISDSFPVGTGFGSFQAVYATYENTDVADRVFVNNAHNDYLQLVLEAGIFGLALIVGFIAWWVIQTGKIWRSANSSPIIRAATIASGAILFHSAVDYPARTSAIGGILAFCVGIMARPPEACDDQTRKGLRRAARHVRIA